MATTIENGGQEANVQRRRRCENVSEQESWNLLKVLLELLETLSVRNLLEHVKCDDWNKTMNGVNLWEKIQAEPGANESRTGSCLKNFFKQNVKRRPDFIQKFETRLGLYDVAQVNKLKDLISAYREKRRYPNSLLENANIPPLPGNTKTAPTPFSLLEQGNIVFGVCCLLERYSVEDVKRCLKGKWNLEVEDALNLADFIRAIDGSDKHRPLKSFQTKWHRMAGRDGEQLFVRYDGVLKEFSSEVQNKLRQVVNTTQIA